MSPRVTVNVGEELEWVLNSGDSKSETVREGLRAIADERSTTSYEGLRDEEAQAYDWLVDRVDGSGTVMLEIIKTELAQVLSKDKELIRTSILLPLSQKGYIDVRPLLFDVKVYVYPPEEVA